MQRTLSLLVVTVVGIGVLVQARAAFATDQTIFSWENDTHGYFVGTDLVTPTHVNDVSNPLAVTDGDYAMLAPTVATTTFARPDLNDYSADIANAMVGNHVLKVDFAIANPDLWTEDYQYIAVSIIVKSHDFDGSNYMQNEAPSDLWARAKNGTAMIDYYSLNPLLTEGRDEVKIEFRLARGGGFSDAVYLDNFRVELLAAPLTGDLNGDGFVGQDDLNIVLGAWGTNVTPGDPLAGDPSGDGFVGQDDLNDILSGWGQGTPPSGLSLIPEPASAALVTLGGLALLRRRRSA